MTWGVSGDRRKDHVSARARCNEGREGSIQPAPEWPESAHPRHCRTTLGPPMIYRHIATAELAQNSQPGQPFLEFTFPIGVA